MDSSQRCQRAVRRLARSAFRLRSSSATRGAAALTAAATSFAICAVRHGVEKPFVSADQSRFHSAINTPALQMNAHPLHSSLIAPGTASAVKHASDRIKTQPIRMTLLGQLSQSDCPRRQDIHCNREVSVKREPYVCLQSSRRADLVRGEAQKRVGTVVHEHLQRGGLQQETRVVHLRQAVQEPPLVLHALRIVSSTAYESG